jgi:MFS family permease
VTEYNQIQPLGLRSLPRKQVIITFTGVMLAMFLSSLDQTAVGTAMPRIIAELGGFSKYTWVTTAYIITSAVAIPITGKMTDLYGRKFLYAPIMTLVLPTLKSKRKSLKTNPFLIPFARLFLKLFHLAG